MKRDGLLLYHAHGRSKPMQVTIFSQWIRACWNIDANWPMDHMSLWSWLCYSLNAYRNKWYVPEWDTLPDTLHCTKLLYHAPCFKWKQERFQCLLLRYCIIFHSFHLSFSWYPASSVGQFNPSNAIWDWSPLPFWMTELRKVTGYHKYHRTHGNMSNFVIRTVYDDALVTWGTKTFVSPVIISVGSHTYTGPSIDGLKLTYSGLWKLLEIPIGHVGP